MAEGTYYSGGVDRFMKEGSPQENIELPAAGFQEQLHKMELSGDAELIAEKYEFGAAVAKLLEKYSVDQLTPAICESFLFQSDKFSEYHPAAVLAVAKVIDRLQKSNQPTKH